MLKAAGLSRSTFYYHAKQPKENRDEVRLKAKIQRLYSMHKARYGYRRMTSALHTLGYRVNHKKVLRLMRALGLKSKIKARKYRSYKGEIGRIAPNHLQRQFCAQRPNEKWVTDVTEFNVKGEKLYLSPVMDLYNGEIIGYQTNRRPVLPLMMNMLKKCYRKLSEGQTPMLHSDQGWHYQHSSYRQALKERGLEQGMSRKGNCLDNAAMESFFGTLKTEMFYQKAFESISELEQDIKEYIRYYNYDRIKLKLKGLSPVDYRIQALKP